MDLNLHELAEAFTLDGDSDDDARVSQGSGEETGVAGCDLEFEQTPSALGVTKRKATQTVPEFVQRLLAAELKEWTLAQGELLSRGVHTVSGDIGIALQDYAARLEILGRLPCRADDAAPNHSGRPQAPSTGPERRPPQRRDGEDSLRKKPSGRAPHGRNGLSTPNGLSNPNPTQDEDADDVLAAHTLCNSLGRHSESWTTLAAQGERPPCWVAQGERAAMLATAERAEVRTLTLTVSK